MLCTRARGFRRGNSMLAFRLAVEYRTSVGRKVKSRARLRAFFFKRQTGIAVLFGADLSDRLFRMAKKKVAAKKKVGGKKKVGAKKSSKKAAPIKKKSVTKKATTLRRGNAGNEVVRGVAKKSAAKKVRGITEEIHSPMRSSLGGGGGDFGVEQKRPRRGMGSGAAGQSGDTEGISRDEDMDSESVEELLEEGQSFEAEVVSGVENARPADQGEVTTHEVSEEDVPGEYED